MPSFHQLRASLTEIVWEARKLGGSAELVAQAVWLAMLAGDPYPLQARAVAESVMREAAQGLAVTAALASLEEYERQCATGAGNGSRESRSG